MATMGPSGWGMMRSMRRREELGGKRVAPGTALRVIRFARPYRTMIAVFLVIVVASSVIAVVTPLLAGNVINAITRSGPDAGGIVVRIAVLIAGAGDPGRRAVTGATSAVLAHR